jgi:predicted DNA-binding protein
LKTARFTKALTIALHPDVYEQIKQVTDAEKTSMAEWVRDAVEAALNNFNQKGEIM